jgi:hypothetical protein
VSESNRAETAEAEYILYFGDSHESYSDGTALTKDAHAKAMGADFSFVFAPEDRN